MKKMIQLITVVWVITFIFPELIQAAEGETTPQKLTKKAYFLVRQARKALYQKEDRVAYDTFIQALAVYEEIVRQYPDWQADSIQAKIEQCREESNTIGMRIFTLPEGYVEIKRGMTREGDRYNKGRIDEAKVKKIGENQYDVGGNTVTLVREGPLLGASCTGPDYTYRGQKYGFACRHIWAVILKEKLLK